MLKFVQGSDIKEKSFGIPEFDGKQVILFDICRFSGARYLLTDILCVCQQLKLVWKDLVGMIKKTLSKKKFKDNLHYDSKVEKYF